MSGSDQAHKIDQRVGARIADLRRQRGLSSAELAFALGVEETVLDDLESGATRTSASLLFSLCQALGCRPHDLLTGV